MSEELNEVCKSDRLKVAEKVVVAVKASSKEIPKTALIWALTHVVQPGDCIKLLVVVSSQNSGRKFLGFRRLSGDCAMGGHRRSFSGTSSEQKFDITAHCSRMILQLHDVYDPNKVNVKIKVVSANPCGAVAEEAKRIQANWVVLDKHLKHEAKQCTDKLQCNIVVMKHSQPKILRLNLLTRKEQSDATNHESSNKKENKNNYSNPLVVTPSSSPETFTTTDPGTSSVSSSDNKVVKQDRDNESSSSDTDSESLSSSSSLRYQPWMAEIVTSHYQSNKHSQTSRTRTLIEKLLKLDQESGFGSPTIRSNQDFSGNLRASISLTITPPLLSPPLCSICQHKSPLFGKPPNSFTYAELALATGDFSKANFLAEGGFGSVYRGVLPDGQAIAVKQHKLASSQGDREFCSEVEVLSCAQHRNVVMLIGFCIEDGRKLLVYEYICNGSLDSHLYGEFCETLAWSARQKIAVGAARGLRYLHEECRVGCIVHRDLRPNNILITHDFEPLVGDFGLARWQPDGEKGVDTRVIGTFGYLAPEYAQSGQITEKADVYSFGVVLVELVTGRKAVDFNRPKGQQCLTEWARPLFEAYDIDSLIDPRLESNYTEDEVYCMLHAASLCLSRDPLERPRISQVLRILEGNVTESSRVLSPGIDVGNRSGRVWSLEKRTAR